MLLSLFRLPLLLLDIPAPPDGWEIDPVDPPNSFPVWIIVAVAVIAILAVALVIRSTKKNKR